MVTEPDIRPVPDIRPGPASVEITEESLRAFVADQAAHLTPPTIEKYLQVVDSLTAFLDSVDVEPCLGPELARLLETARARQPRGAFLPTLGAVSLLRVLPLLLADPWLPPPGGERRTHRVVLAKLLRFLRRADALDTGALRRDFKGVRDALGAVYSLDHDYSWGRQRTEEEVHEQLVTVTVTLSLRSPTLDRLLDEVERGDRASLDEAIQKSVDPDPYRYLYPYDDHTWRRDPWDR